MKTKENFRVWIFIRNILLTIIVLSLVWIVFHYSMKVYEKNFYPPIGELVEIDGKHIHIYTKGDGKNAIVLLSGLGTAAPVMDFEPLVNEMAKENKVVVVEPFGYGWSDITDRERTVENIVEEIRYALKKTNMHGPYVLMPHSISGIYSMYFANTYPEEVKAVIGIDPTLPQAWNYFEETPPLMPKYLGCVAPIGIARIALNINPHDFLPIADNGAYSEDNLEITKAISAWKISNRNVVNEANEIKNNIAKTVDMKFPSNMPVLLFTTKEDKVTEDGKYNVNFYETQLTDSFASKIVTLQGHHYLHWTHYKEMSSEVNEFMKNL